MSELPAYGKISKDFFDAVIYPKLGAKRGEIIVGPSTGADTCAIKIGTAEVLVATTDPLSFIPELGPIDSAWLSVNLIASDLATSSFQPQYAVFNLNLPPSMPSADFVQYWDALSAECSRLGTAIVGGHTGKFEGCNYTVIGGGMMMSVGSASRYISSKGGSPGDKIILTKGAAIATTGILSRVFPKSIEKKIDKVTARLGATYFKRISVVEDALLASRVGVRSSGVTAMHDATEGGVLSALYELAAASSTGLLVEKEKIPVSKETRAICQLFDIDPLTSVSEGSLVIASSPRYADTIMKALEGRGIGSAIVGELMEPEYGHRILDKGKEKAIQYPIADPYWKAFYGAKKKNWN